MSDLDHYVALHARKRLLESELSRVRVDLADTQERLLEAFADEGVSAKRTDGGALVHTRRQIWARAAGGDKQRATRALAALPDFSHLVDYTFNTHTLSAIFRQRAKEADGYATLADLLPAKLVGRIELSEDVTLGVRVHTTEVHPGATTAGVTELK